MTVGKIYGGLLIFENWKATKFGNVPFPKVNTVTQLAYVFLPCTKINLRRVIIVQY